MEQINIVLVGHRPNWNPRGPRRYLFFEQKGSITSNCVGLSEGQYQWLKERWPYPVEEDEGEAWNLTK